MNKKTIAQVSIITLLSLPIFYLFSDIVIITSRSIDKRVLFITDLAPEKGDYVLFDLDHKLAGEEPVKIAKQLNCYAGDVLSVKDRSYYCNDSFLGYAKLKGLSGRELPQFIFNGVIPEGMAFAHGVHIDSFDSRYWGLLDLSEAITLKPVF